jgi:hypothetical protein
LTITIRVNPGFDITVDDIQAVVQVPSDY